MFINSTIFIDFLQSYLSSDYTLQKEFSSFIEIVSYNTILRNKICEFLDFKFLKMGKNDNKDDADDNKIDMINVNLNLDDNKNMKINKDNNNKFNKDDNIVDKDDKINDNIDSHKNIILLPNDDKVIIKKSLQILRKIASLSKGDIEKYDQIIKTLIKISSMYEFVEDSIFILSKLKIEKDLDRQLLLDLSEITNINLSTNLINELTLFCKNNIKNNILEFLTILLDNSENGLFLIIDLSIEYKNKYKNEDINNKNEDTNSKNEDTNSKNDNINSKIDNINNRNEDIRKFLNTLYDSLDENLVDYTNLTLFGLFEEFVCFSKQNDKDLIEKYKYKRNTLELNIILNQEEINNFTYTNDIIIPFLSKFNILNFTNKKNYFYDKLDYYSEESFIVTVNRKSCLSDSFFQIMRKSAKELKARKIQIKFSGEQGLDFGGLTKEWLELLIKNILDPNQGMFIHSSDKKSTMIPYKNSNINTDHLLFFRFIGRILAIIIIDGYNVDIHFDKSIYKYLIDKSPVLEDLEEIDPQYYNSLLWIRNNNIDNILHLNFTIENEELGVFKINELIPNGKDILVTDINKNEYINLIIKNKFISSIEQQLKAIKEGLKEMIDEELIKLFNEKELELLICGIPEINVEDWKNNTEYKGYTNNTKTVVWFWKVVEGFTSDEKALLLQFCTGSSRVPHEGFKNLQSTNGIQKFSIHKITGKRLPTAHTCFNQLDLPEYSSYEELRKYLVYAITECKEGFQLI